MKQQMTTAKKGITHGFKTDITHGFKTDITHGFKTDIKRGFKTDITHGFKTYITHGFKMTLIHGFKTTITHGLKTDITHVFKTYITHGFKMTLTHAFTSITHGLPGAKVKPVMMKPNPPANPTKARTRTDERTGTEQQVTAAEVNTVSYPATRAHTVLPAQKSKVVPAQKTKHGLHAGTLTPTTHPIACSNKKPNPLPQPPV